MMHGSRTLRRARTALIALMLLAFGEATAQGIAPRLGTRGGNGTAGNAARANASPAQAAQANAAVLRVARDIMRAARYAALITQDVGAGAAARTIDPAPPDSGMVVRFVTNPRSRKVRQIGRDSRVALHYFDAKGLRYVTLYGRAREVRDGAAKRRLWYAEWTPVYPGRERDATLYEVIPERAEVVSPGEGMAGDTVTWAAPTIRFPRQPSR